MTSLVRAALTRQWLSSRPRPSPHGGGERIKAWPRAIAILAGLLLLSAGFGEAMAPAIVGAATPGRILFGHSGDIWMAADGASAPVTEGGRYWGQPDGAPDGTKIALVGWNANGSDVYVLNPDTDDLRQITRPQGRAAEWTFYPRWSPDGDTLAYLSDRTSQYTMLWMMKSDGSGQRQLTRPTGQLDSFDTFSWAPDGSMIAVTGYSGATSQIYLVNPNRADAPRAITKEPGGAFDPAWAPDGHSIAYVTRDGKRYSIRVLDMNSDDEPFTLLQSDMARSPGWSPAGAALAYLALSGSEFELYVVNIGVDSDGHMIAGKPSQMTDHFGIDATSGLSWAP